jgi:hypothetical protein
MKKVCSPEYLWLLETSRIDTKRVKIPTSFIAR